MAKKLRSWRVLSCILAVFATIAFLIACGDGELVDVSVGESLKSMNDADDNFFGTKMQGIKDSVKNMSSSSKEESSSSSEPDDNGNNNSSSSSENASTQSSSSTKNASSSSNETQKSSSSNPYTLDCSVIKSPIEAYKNDYEVNAIFKITCKEGGRNVDIEDIKNKAIFSGTNENDRRFSISNPVPGTFSNLEVEIASSANVCQGMKKPCGTLVVSAASTPSSSSAPNNTPSSSSRNNSTTSSNSSTPSSSSAPNNTPSSASGGTGVSPCPSGETRGNNCLWNESGACWPLNNDRENCAKNGWIFQGGETGATSGCKGGTFICGKSTSPPAGGAASLGCCHWDTETKCWDVFTETAKNDCSGGNNKFTSTKCPDTEGTCPNGIK